MIDSRLKQQLFDAGLAALEAGRFAEAAEQFRQLVERMPILGAAHANLAFALERLNDANAGRHYQQALLLSPKEPQMAINYGAWLHKHKQFAQAEQVYRDAIARQPNAALYANLGALLACLKREDEALQCYASALEIDPDHGAAQFNRAYIELRRGDWLAGWASLEARNWYAPLAAYLQFPRWQGEPLAGKSVLLSYEAGHGDVIQFCRYAALIKAAGASRITLLCHPPLKRLLAGVPAIDELIAFNEPVPATGWDYWSPLLSLPGLFGTTPDNAPAEIPYIHVDIDIINQWQHTIPQSDLRVGLAWRGSTAFENDADRSLPDLAPLAPLLALPGIHWISLQKGPGEADPAPASCELHRLGPQFTDFADTAAVISQLDLIISVDTAVAHLAGALGKPCWLLLPDYKTDWRWLTERNDTPWYPGMKLFRQHVAGEWADVVAALCREIKQFAPKP